VPPSGYICQRCQQPGTITCCLSKSAMTNSFKFMKWLVHCALRNYMITRTIRSGLLNSSMFQMW
jgi:hypothetical protein